MELHPSCRIRLTERLAEGLRKVQFKNQYFLDYLSFKSLDACSLVLPSKIQEGATAWISSDPLRDFSYGFIVEHLGLYAKILSQLPKEEFPVLLSDIADTAQMAAQIVDSFATLPWEYTVVMPFVSNGGVDFRLKQLPLSKKLSIKKSSELSFPLPERPELYSLAKVLEVPTDWSTDRLYLEAKLEGYIGVGTTTETIEQFYHQVRVVSGIGLAVNAFNLRLSNHSTSLMFPASLQTPLFIYRKDERGEATGRTMYVPDRIGPLEQLELHQNGSERTLLLPVAFGESNECSRLREAGQWYFASSIEKSEIFEFVEAVVVLEILFNDKATAGEVGVEKLIANRCAYLVASSTAERQEIMKEFESIYEARSSIVHKGKARLNKAERHSLIQAKVLGAMSIERELGMIFRSQK